MQPVYIAYYSYLLLGIATLVALAYAVPGRMKTLYPSDYERIQSPPAAAASSYGRDIILATGDRRLRLYVWLQQTGFYIWALGGIAFTVVLFLAD